jgi:hypothetical protein
MSQTRVEVLTFDGCPHGERTFERARAAIAAANVAADLRLVRVTSEEEALRLRFLGSPTVRVNGADVDPTAAERDDYGIHCRVYSVEGRLEGAPPLEWIVASLRRGETASP